jgi:hypothetical protein
MKTQRGSIEIRRGSWFLRWRESGKPRSKVLSAITSEYLKNRGRKTGKPRFPAEIQAQADKILQVVSHPMPESFRLTVAELVTTSCFLMWPRLCGRPVSQFTAALGTCT